MPYYVNVSHQIGREPMGTFGTATGRAPMTSATFAGFGAEDGAAARVDLPVRITPRDARGNPAAIAPSDASRFVVSVSPTTRAAMTSAPTFDPETGDVVATWKATAPGDVVVVVTLDGAHLPIRRERSPSSSTRCT